MKILHYHDADSPEALLTRSAAARFYLEQCRSRRRWRGIHAAVTVVLLIILGSEIWCFWL